MRQQLRRHARLVLEHVEGRAADAAGCERGDQRGGIDHRAAAHVDEQRARPHEGEAARVEQVA